MKRRGARTANILPSLSQPHPRGYTVALSYVRKGSPHGNLTRILVVHLVEGGSSTTGEQTNCDLTCYVKKRQTMWEQVLLMCPVNSQNAEKLA